MQNPMMVTIFREGRCPVQIKRKHDAGGYHFTLQEARIIARKLVQALAHYDALSAPDLKQEERD